MNNYDWNTEEEWLAANGNVEARFNVAVREIKDGELKEGFSTLVELADEGHEISQLQVGSAYLLGHINETYYVKRDVKKAKKYLNKSAKQGNKYAKMNLKSMKEDLPISDYKSTRCYG